MRSILLLFGFALLFATGALLLPERPVQAIHCEEDICDDASNSCVDAPGKNRGCDMRMEGGCQTYECGIQIE